MAYSWLINKRLPGTGAWTTGVLCLSLGIVFFIISASYNYALIKIAGLFFRMGGACIIVYGCGVFIGRALSKKISIALFSLFSLFSVILLVNRELRSYLIIIDIFFIIIYIRGVVILVSARRSGIKGGFAVVYPLSFFALFHFYNFLRFYPLFGRNLREFSIGEIASTYTVFLGALVMTQVLQGYFKFRNEIIAIAEEKEMLLREMHNRTKNNLSLINNMVALDSMYVEDPGARNILEILCNKIKTIMLLHQQLQDVEVADSINAQEYLGLVVDSFSDSRIGGENIVRLEKNIEPIELEVSSAIPIGLILNELTTNCCKHAKVFKIFAVNKEAECLNCLKCENKCIMNVPLAEKGNNRDTACISCLRCIDVCPGNKEYLHF